MADSPRSFRRGSSGGGSAEGSQRSSAGKVSKTSSKQDKLESETYFEGKKKLIEKRFPGVLKEDERILHLFRCNMPKTFGHNGKLFLTSHHFGFVSNHGNTNRLKRISEIQDTLLGKTDVTIILRNGKRYAFLKLEAAAEAHAHLQDLRNALPSGTQVTPTVDEKAPPPDGAAEARDPKTLPQLVVGDGTAGTGVDSPLGDSFDERPFTPCTIPGVPEYTYLKTLGKGSWGKVYLVRCEDDGVAYVRKDVNLAGAKLRHIKHAMAEVSVMASLNHPHVVKHKDSFFEHGVLTIVMEYCDDGDLDGKIRSQREKRRYFSDKAIKACFTQMCLGLKHVHDAGVFHRDIKPANIFVDSSGGLKLGDFGFASIVSSATEMRKSRLGTPAYMPPEIMRGEFYDAKADVWALGCVLFKLCNLQAPFTGKDFNSLLLSIKNDNPQLAAAARLDPTLQDVVGAMLAKAPKDRPSINALFARFNFLAEEARTILPNDVYTRDFPDDPRFLTSSLGMANHMHASGHSDDGYFEAMGMSGQEAYSLPASPRDGEISPSLATGSERAFAPLRQMYFSSLDAALSQRSNSTTEELPTSPTTELSPPKSIIRSHSDTDLNARRCASSRSPTVVSPVSLSSRDGRLVEEIDEIANFRRRYMPEGAHRLGVRSPVSPVQNRRAGPLHRSHDANLMRMSSEGSLRAGPPAAPPPQAYSTTARKPAPGGLTIMAPPPPRGVAAVAVPEPARRGRAEVSVRVQAADGEEGLPLENG